jgi:hypothetical protein
MDWRGQRWQLVIRASVTQRWISWWLYQKAFTTKDTKVHEGRLTNKALATLRVLGGSPVFVCRGAPKDLPH